jgi:hypothetical protein
MRISLTWILGEQVVRVGGGCNRFRIVSSGGLRVSDVDSWVLLPQYVCTCTYYIQKGFRKRMRMNMGGLRKGIIMFTC